MTPLSRGFYAATFVAKYGKLGNLVVLKVAPRGLYSFFGKDFSAECTRHKEVADGGEHLVQIRDFIDETVAFGDVEIDCHVAVLDYVKGTAFDEYLDSSPSLESLGQVAIDLLQLLQELKDARYYHNDLHDQNILVQTLAGSARRHGALDPSVRAIAIDLGSTALVDRQDEQHLGDLQAVVMHLFGIAQAVLDSATADPSEYRIASAIDEVSHMFSPDRASQRDPDFEGAIRKIRAGLDPARNGWSAPQVLQRFDDGYNAQSLHPWLLPRLLVDPDGEWLASVSVRGPQLITGMRGCGKTMLLRAMDIHARIIQHEIDQVPSITAALASDGYIGLYVSCTRLLDPLGRAGEAMHEPYARLFVAYAREACAGLQHVEDRQPSSVRNASSLEIADICASVLDGADSLRGAESLIDLEQRLQQVLASLDRGESTFRMLQNPALAFPQLAEVILDALPSASGAQVLFLLDDVSTRHVSKQDVDELISSLLFSHPTSAFKMTTEAQTFLRSPGQIELARSGRDYQTFDLGAEVNAKLRDNKNSSEGLAFVSQVLENRAELFGLHPTNKPFQLLGNTSLESIATSIASTSKGSREKKAVYHGLSALRAVCVGDIGDVISIYDLMLSKARDRREMPIAATTQSEALQEFCSRRLYQVNRRASEGLRSLVRGGRA